MHLIIAASGYPMDTNPEFSFVGELVNTFADLGHECEVIAPFSLSAWLLRRHEYRPSCWTYKTASGANVTVHQPRYISFSGLPLSRKFRNRSILIKLRRIARQQSVLYAHFWESGIPLARYAKKYGNVFVVASGESRIPKISKGETELLMTTVDVVVAVSSKNKKESIERGLCSASKVSVLPNAVGEAFFQHHDKKKCRELLSLPQDDLIALFVGHFNERKGAGKVDEALSAVGGIKSVFLGAGKLEPKGKHCVFKGRVPHEELPKYLAAADMFVLPTQAEGCCNAIVEALAVGVPVISSDLDFNYDILDDNCSLMVDPNDTKAIGEAIATLRDDSELRKRLANNAKEKGKSFRLTKRAKGIIKLINDFGRSDDRVILLDSHEYELKHGNDSA